MLQYKTAIKKCQPFLKSFLSLEKVWNPAKNGVFGAERLELAKKGYFVYTKRGVAAVI